jgi:hypothetical protein
MPKTHVPFEKELRARVIQLIEDGRLPIVLSTYITAGCGTGIRCDLCDHPIAADTVEHDVIDPFSEERLHFHLRATRPGRVSARFV